MINSSELFNQNFDIPELSDPKTMADAIVLATHHYDDGAKVAEAMAMTEGSPMKGDELETLEIRLDQRGW